MKYFVTIDQRTFEVELGPDGTTVDGERLDADLAAVQGTGTYSLLLDGASHRVAARRGEGDAWHVTLDGDGIRADVVDERSRAIREMTGSADRDSGPRPVRAPMPGLVVKVEVAEGDEVAVGDGLVIVEAMKMENELRAEAPGRVKAVRVEPGEAVDKDQVLVEFEPPEPDEGANGGAEEEEA